MSDAGINYRTVLFARHYIVVSNAGINYRTVLLARHYMVVSNTGIKYRTVLLATTPPPYPQHTHK